MSHAHRTYDARQGEIDRLAAENKALAAEVKIFRGLLERMCWNWDDEMNNVDCGPSYDTREEARAALNKEG